MAHTLTVSVVQGLVDKDTQDEIERIIREFKFIPGGRYLYYAGKSAKFYNNCYLLKAEEDTREDWANLSWKSESCLTTGGGIGVDYSVYRPRNSRLSRTGGVASGPVPKMAMVNEIGRYVIQGGSRRSAIYASLNWQHADIQEFMKAKDWHNMPVKGTDKTIWDLKNADLATLTQLLGPKIAVSVKKQVGITVDKIPVKENKRKGQISLMDY